MIRSAIFPGRYIQGENALSVLNKEIRRFGKRTLLLLTHYAYNNLLESIKSFIGDEIAPIYEEFGGECSDEEIDRITSIGKSGSVDVIIGIGGGKTLDTAKVTAYNLGVPVIIAPTIASTDAPCSANSVIYTESGEFKRYFMLPRNPDTVLVDTTVIANAPVRFLVSGMGDALSTKFEAESCREKYANNLSGYKGSITAYELANLCYNILMEYGRIAKVSCESNVVTSAFDYVVEANTLLSGLGFESGGLAAAHAIHNGLTVLSQTHKYYHGEKVAFGTLASLFLIDKERETIEEVYQFCMEVGLPITLEDIGLRDISDDDLMRVAEAACRKDETIHNEPRPIEPMDVFNALKVADLYGKDYKSGYC